MQFDLRYDSSVGSAPAGFKTALVAAAQYLDHIITNPITVNIGVGWNEVAGSSMPADAIAEGGPAQSPIVSYNRVRTALQNAINSPATATAYQNLPATDPTGGAGILVAPAQEKAWGLLPANHTATDGYVGFSSNFSYDYNSSGPVPSNEYYFISIAEHELTHALGRTSGLAQGLGMTVLDLYRYTAPGALATSASAPTYFSIDGGTTNLDNFSATADPSDWASSAGADSFDAFYATGQISPVTATDITEMNVLGFAVACFAAGTRIRTPRGDVAVEALRAGVDHVLTARGKLARIVWIGSRQVVPARHPRPQEVTPVRVCRGALGPGRPARDLLLSPDHALLLGGVLIPVRYLVNGRTIAPVPVPRVRYFHVELARHDVLLAESVPAESYLDTGNRAAFANAGRPMRPAPGRARRIWATQGCADLVAGGPRLIAARRLVLRRAAALGHGITDDPALAVLADGKTLTPTLQGRHCVAALPRGTRSVRLLSRAGVPAHTAATSPDTRRLGIAVARLWLDGVEAALDDPRLQTGWHAAEPGWRWTDGDATVPVSGARHLAFEMAMTGRYWLTPAAG